jgi:DNA-binding NarL/FixJ family response regulator
MKGLVMDDHAFVQAGLRRVLTRMSPATVRKAGSGREALAQAGSEAFDLMFRT